MKTMVHWNTLLLQLLLLLLMLLLLLLLLWRLCFELHMLLHMVASSISSCCCLQDRNRRGWLAVVIVVDGVQNWFIVGKRRGCVPGVLHHHWNIVSSSWSLDIVDSCYRSRDAVVVAVVVVDGSRTVGSGVRTDVLRALDLISGGGPLKTVVTCPQPSVSIQP